jgi:hypothetical protein
MKPLLLAGLFAGASLSAFSQVNYVVQPSAIPYATPAQIAEWNLTQSTLLGIRAIDPANFRLNPDYHAYYDATLANPERWYPLMAEKQNMGATIVRYGTEEASHTDEKDWNLMLRPLPEYKFMMDLAKANPDKTISEWFKCNCNDPESASRDCMFAEITPHLPFFSSNNWFQDTDGDHCKQANTVRNGEKIGVYGCFVKDRNHGYNPEIHPVQQIWFENKPRSTPQRKSYMLFLIQDASGRMYRNDKMFYNTGGSPPADSLLKYRAWALSPVVGCFRIAFKIPRAVLPGGSPMTVNLEIQARREISTISLPYLGNDCDDGVTHALVIGNNTVLRVNEPAGFDEDLGIRFVELAMLRDGSIQGYIEIGAAVGDYFNDGAGYLVIMADIIPARGPVVSQ